MSLRELHLFAGIGGGVLAGQMLGHTPVCAVEIEPFCRAVLAKHWPGLPIHDDIRTFNGSEWRGRVDIVCGGFPCQPWSAAGKRLGVADPRHLWPEMARVIAEVRPRFVFAENVSLAAFAEPWRDLRGLGYRVPPAVCISAADVGAPHIRKRWWLLAADADCDQHEGSARPHQGETAEGLHEVADSKSLGRGARRPESAREQGRLGPAVGRGAMGDADGLRELQPQGIESNQWRRIGDTGWWATEPNVGRVAHGVPARVDRLRGLGNAQVPAQAAAAFRILMGNYR